MEKTVKVDYVDENTFQKTTHEYPEFQVQVVDKIVAAFGTDTNFWPVIADKDGKKLITLAVDMSVDRSMRELGHGKYKITIEPLGVWNEND